MKQSLNKWQFLGFWVVSILGTVFHFIYPWTGKSLVLSWLGSVNDSTWEHMKLIFWPMVIFAIVQRMFFKDLEGYWWIKFKGILVGVSMVPVIFYTYNGSIGESTKVFNVLLFFIAVGIAYFYEARQFKLARHDHMSSGFSIAGICVVAVLFIVFTYATPKLLIFLDPLYGGYGIA